MVTGAPSSGLTKAYTHVPPSLDLIYRDDIKFLHPGYPSPVNRLLSLARTDGERSEISKGVTFGVGHETALVACQIIAGNIFNTGYFALDQAGLQRVSVSLDPILTRDEYFFIVDGDMASFRDWRFPHNNLPNGWLTSSHTGRAVPSICSVTAVSYAIDEAHIVPREEVHEINDEPSILPMRTDLHECFDDRWFAVVPKAASNGTQYVTHILTTKAAEIWPDCHNVAVHRLHPRSFPYLFARFAWAIFGRIKGWINAGAQRDVIRAHVDSKGYTQYETERISGPQLRILYGHGWAGASTDHDESTSEDDTSSERILS